MPCKKNSSSAECFLDFLWRMLIMAVVMLVLFVGILIPSLFFTSHAASHQGDKLPMIYNKLSNYFVMEEPGTEKEKKPFDPASIFKTDGEKGKGFQETVFTNPFKTLDSQIYPQIVGFNGYDKVYDSNNKKLIFFSMGMYFFLPIIMILYSVIGALFYIFGKGFAYFALNEGEGYHLFKHSGNLSLLKKINNVDTSIGGKIVWSLLLIVSSFAGFVLYFLLGLAAGFVSGVGGMIIYLFKTMYRFYINPLLQGDIFMSTAFNKEKFDFGGKLKEKEGTSFFRYILQKLTFPFLALYSINVAIAAGNDFSSSPLLIGTITITLLASFFSYLRKNK